MAQSLCGRFLERPLFLFCVVFAGYLLGPAAGSASGQILDLATAKTVYVQPEPIFMTCSMSGLEAGTPLNLTISLELPDGRLAFLGPDGLFGPNNPLWLVTGWAFVPLAVQDGQWPLITAPEMPMAPGRYRLRGEIYSAYSNTLISRSEADFFLVDAPYLDHAYPATGITGDVISLHGEGFGTAADLVKVTIGGREATIIEISDSVLHTWVPYGAVTGDAVVSVDGAASNPLAFLVGPYIEKVSRTVVEPGGALDIEGFNFDPDRNRNYVDFNGIRGTVQAAGATKLKVIVPEGNTGPLSVQVNGMVSNPVAVTVTPVVESISPERGEAGEVAVISGRNFDPLMTNNYVVFNAGSDTEVAATILEAAVTQLVVRVPPAETGDVEVYADGQQALGDLVFTFPPEIDEVTPEEVVAGDSLAIAGRNFHDSEARNTVTLGDETLTISSALSHSITARTSIGSSSGSLAVIVNGLSSQQAPFVVVYPAPLLRSVSPSSLPAADSATQVVLTGVGFVAGLSVALTGPAGQFPVTPAIAAYDRLTFKLPRGISSGTYALSVTRTVAGRTRTSNSLTMVLN